jgi:hypothetical protein
MLSYFGIGMALNLSYFTSLFLQLHVQVIDTFIGIPTPQQSRCRIKEISGNRIKITVAVILVIAISMSIIAAIIFTIKYRQRHEFYQPTAGLSYQVSYNNLNFKYHFGTKFTTLQYTVSE